MSSKPTSFTMQEVIDASGSDHNLKAALGFVLKHEGMVLEEVKNDPGGATICGITHEDYDAFRHEHHEPIQSLSKATAVEIAACYREHYWQICQCAKVAFPVALTLFDTAVLCGPGRAVRWLQIELGVVVDGVIGQNTLAAVGIYVQKHGAKPLAEAVIKQRRDFHMQRGQTKKLKGFLKGWLNRVDDLSEAVDNA